MENRVEAGGREERARNKRKLKNSRLSPKRRDVIAFL